MKENRGWHKKGVCLLHFTLLNVVGYIWCIRVQNVSNSKNYLAITATIIYQSFYRRANKSYVKSCCGVNLPLPGENIFRSFYKSSQKAVNVGCQVFTESSTRDIVLHYRDYWYSELHSRTYNFPVLNCYFNYLLVFHTETHNYSRLSTMKREICRSSKFILIV